jgi:hypothetical protein
MHTGSGVVNGEWSIVNSEWVLRRCWCFHQQYDLNEWQENKVKK